MSQYRADVPASNLVKPEIRDYYEHFYAVSDTPDAHQKYAELYTKNAKLIMASNEANGRDGTQRCGNSPHVVEDSRVLRATDGLTEIVKMRHGMWEKVAKRSHKPTKLFSFGGDSDEVMLYGTVDYELKDGRRANVDWSARSHFTHEDGQLKMDFYQVYLVSFCVAKIVLGLTLPRTQQLWHEQSDSSYHELSDFTLQTQYIGYCSTRDFA